MDHNRLVETNDSSTFMGWPKSTTLFTPSLKFVNRGMATDNPRSKIIWLQYRIANYNDIVIMDKIIIMIRCTP